MKYITRFSARIAAVACWMVFISIIWFLSSSDVRAEVRVSGSKVAMVVEARNASLDEIVAALNSVLNAQVSFTSRSNSVITGVYSGTLRRVLTRILDGHDFVLSSSSDRIAINLVTHAGTTAVRRSAAIVDSLQAQANNANNNIQISNDEPNSSGIQGWTGAFSNQSPSTVKP
jgi:hypothetical protein